MEKKSRIASLINRSGLTKTKVAELVGTSRETIYAWMNKDPDEKYELLQSVLNIKEPNADYSPDNSKIIELKARLFDTEEKITRYEKECAKLKREVDFLKERLRVCKERKAS